LIERIETVELPSKYGDRGRLLRRIYEEREGVDLPTDEDREANEHLWAPYDAYWEALWGGETDDG